MAALVEDADAVVVATPATERFGLLVAAMTEGLPVFCEKPLAAGLDEARELAEAARRTGARVQVGFPAGSTRTIAGSTSWWDPVRPVG